MTDSGDASPARPRPRRLERPVPPRCPGMVSARGPGARSRGPAVPARAGGRPFSPASVVTMLPSCSHRRAGVEDLVARRLLRSAPSPSRHGSARRPGRADREAGQHGGGRLPCARGEDLLRAHRFHHLPVRGLDTFEDLVDVGERDDLDGRERRELLLAVPIGPAPCLAVCPGMGRVKTLVHRAQVWRRGVDGGSILARVSLR